MLTTYFICGQKNLKDLYMTRANVIMNTSPMTSLGAETDSKLVIKSRTSVRDLLFSLTAI